MEKTSIDPNGNITTTGSLSASNMYNTSQVDGLLANRANAPDVYTKGQVHGLIPDLLNGVMKLYDDTGSGRGVISHPTALHFAITQPINPTGTPSIMTITLDAGVVIYTGLSVGGDLYALNIYNKTQVDYIASAKQATITSSTSFNALNTD